MPHRYTGLLLLLLLQSVEYKFSDLKTARYSVVTENTRDKRNGIGIFIKRSHTKYIAAITFEYINRDDDAEKNIAHNALYCFEN